jgi:hypothetical protein
MGHGRKPGKAWRLPHPWVQAKRRKREQISCWVFKTMRNADSAVKSTTGTVSSWLRSLNFVKVVPFKKGLP